MPTRTPRRLSVQQYSGGNAAQNHSTAAVDVFALNIHGLGWKGHLVNFGKKWLVVSNRFKPAERIWDSDWERSSRICFERTSTSIWNSCLIKPFTSHQGLPWFTFCGWMVRMKCKNCWHREDMGCGSKEGFVSEGHDELRRQSLITRIEYMYIIIYIYIHTYYILYNYIFIFIFIFIFIYDISVCECSAFLTLLALPSAGMAFLKASRFWGELAHSPQALQIAIYLAGSPSENSWKHDILNRCKSLAGYCRDKMRQDVCVCMCQPCIIWLIVFIYIYIYDIKTTNLATVHVVVHHVVDWLKQSHHSQFQPAAPQSMV